MAKKETKAPAADRGGRPEISKDDDSERAERERATAKGKAWRGGRDADDGEKE